MSMKQEGIVQTLIDRFKDMRRIRKPVLKNKPTSTPEKPPSKKMPKRKSLTELPDVPTGEDEVSFERHNRVLQAEWKKSTRNMMVIEELMMRTFAFRRKKIVENPKDVQVLLSEYPFLQQPEPHN